MTPGDSADSVRVPLFVSEVVTIGRWRCAVAHGMFRNSGPARCHCFCFPRTSVWIQHAGRRPFVADPNVVTFYNQGQIYNRYRLDPSGDHTDWFAMPARIITEALVERDPSVVDREERPFRFTHGPSDAQVYLLQRALVHHVGGTGAQDTLFIEELAVELLQRVAELAVTEARWTRSRMQSRQWRELSEAARALLALRFKDALSLTEIALMLETSAFHLARTFRRETGTTLHVYRNHLRLRAALERLAEPHTSVVDVAFAVGYSSHSHFVDSFRRAFGVTAAAVRRYFRKGRAQELARLLSADMGTTDADGFDGANPESRTSAARKEG